MKGVPKEHFFAVEWVWRGKFVIDKPSLLSTYTSSARKRDRRGSRREAREMKWDEREELEGEYEQRIGMRLSERQEGC
jgi:hypothetical protein